MSSATGSRASRWSSPARGRGSGRASALRFAAEGARVLVADVQDDWAEETVRLVIEAGGVAVAQHCDVTVEDDVAAAVAAAAERFGRLDVMFNNAGVTGMKPGMSLRGLHRGRLASDSPRSTSGASSTAASTR